MKVHIIILFFFICYCSHVVSAQSIDPSTLEYKGRKTLCVKGTRKPYTGVIEGYVFYRNIPAVSRVMFQVYSFVFNTNYLYFDSINSNPYVKGYVVDGKAEGEWKIYQVKDSILLIESSFVHGKIDGKMILYDVFNIHENKPIILYYRRGKLLFLE